MARSSTPYVADDAGITLESLDFLHAQPGAPLLHAALTLAAETHAPSVADIDRLRQEFPAPHVRAAMTLAHIQKKGLAKFPGLTFLWATPEALEQASHLVVARWKARRFATAGAAEIIDLCAGVGGDALALAESAAVTAVELSPVRARCLEFNAAQTSQHLQVIVGDLRDLLPHLPPKAMFHIDPARRSGGRRSARYEDLLPGPDVLATVMTHFGVGGVGPAASERKLGRDGGGGGAIKLSPAVDFDSLPQLPGGHLELLSHQRTVVQAVLWLGTIGEQLGRGGGSATCRTATILTGNTTPEAFSYSAEPAAARPADKLLEPPFYLYEVDGAVTRAGIAASLARDLHLQPLTQDAGYLQGAAPMAHPALTGFRIHIVVPYSKQRVATALQALPSPPDQSHAASLEVKSRGPNLQGIDTDQLQRHLKKAAPPNTTVLLFSHRGDVQAAVGHRA
jgi:hypothetical protein